MYEPNSVRGLLNLSKGDAAEQEANAADLISEMDDFIANLQKWKDQRKQLDSEIRAISKPAPSAPFEPDLPEMPEIQPREVDFEALTATHSDRVDIAALSKDLNAVKIGETTLPTGDFRSSDLYEIGQKLKEQLQLPEDLDLASGKKEGVTHSGEAWDTVNEIEKELEELEKELEEVNIRSPKQEF